MSFDEDLVRLCQEGYEVFEPVPRRCAANEYQRFFNVVHSVVNVG